MNFQKQQIATETPSHRGQPGIHDHEEKPLTKRKKALDQRSRKNVLAENAEGAEGTKGERGKKRRTGEGKTRSYFQQKAAKTPENNVYEKKQKQKSMHFYIIKNFFSGVCLIALCFFALLFPASLEARSWFPLEPPTPEAKTTLATLIEGDDTWVGYANYGVIQYDYYGNIKTRITPKEGLPGPTVTDLVKRDTELWIGTSDGLAMRNEGGGLKTFTARDGLPDNGITCLAVVGSVLYAGTMKGLVRFQGESFDVISEAKGLPSEYITALAPCPNGLMIGTTKGWATLSANQIEAHNQADGLPFEWITAVSYFKYRKATLSADSNVSDDWYVLGSAGGGLIFYHDKKYSALRKDDDGPGSDWITSVVFEPITMTLWVGSQDGIGVEDITEGKWLRFTSENSGLISNLVKDISLKVIDEEVKDYEILLGKGSCPGCEVAKRLLTASGTPTPATDTPTLASGTTGTASGSTRIASGTAGLSGRTSSSTASGTGETSATNQPANRPAPTSSPQSAHTNEGTGGPSTGQTTNTATSTRAPSGVSPRSGGNQSRANSSATASGSVSSPETRNATDPMAHFSETCYENNPQPKPCRWCWSIPPVRKAKILHIPQTWAAIGTQEGAEIYYRKILPHYGQGNIYSYIANKGWEIKGLGIGTGGESGTGVFAGVYPPGVAEGFLLQFSPRNIEFGACYANPPDIRFSSQINVLSINDKGYPVAGGESLGRGGLAILDIAKAESSSIANPWDIYGSKEGLTDLNVTALFKEGSSMLVGTGMLGKSGSVFRFKDGKFEKFPRAGLTVDGITSMFRAPVTCLWGDGEIAYVGTKGDGIYYFDGDSWTRYDSFKPKILSDDNIQALTYRDNVLYVGTKKGLDCLSSSGGSHVDITQMGAYTNNVECLLWDDSEGDDQLMVLWIGYHDGFGRFSQQTGVMVHGGKGRSSGTGSMLWPGNPPYQTQVFAEHYPGNPKEERADACPFDGMPGNKVSCMAYDDINLFIGTDNGVCRFRK